VALCAAALFAAAAPAFGALYKWTEANGRVVYSDQPPPTNIKAETLNGPPPPANPNALKEMAAKEGEMKKRQLDRAEASAKADKDRQFAERKADVCKKVKNQIAEYSDQRIAMYRLNDKGEREVMDDATRAKESAKMESWARENC
jgi:hypothetical protein